MLSPLDMFSIGIGPSSSHTVGPMKAGLEFIGMLEQANLLGKVDRLEVHVYGSLALTGEGHGTFMALLNGLSGEHPKTIDPLTFEARYLQIKREQKLLLNKHFQIKFNCDTDLLIHRGKFLSEHANGIKFIAFNENSTMLFEEIYFSIGGGFILTKKQFLDSKGSHPQLKELTVPFPFRTANELFDHCKINDLSLIEVLIANELALKSKEQIYSTALEIAEVMQVSINNGVMNFGILPGGLNLKRRAPNLYQKLKKDNLNKYTSDEQKLLAMTYAIAVNEENANFSRIVTAPTNGSAGTIPAVLEYYRNFYPNVNEEKIVEFLLIAGAMGNLYKYQASISAAEVGCQGEIGVACSMAAAALTSVLGGNNLQIERAAEIAMEHSLGMTCDPVKGLVQVPCIERNGIAAGKAIDITKLVLLEDSPGILSLDLIARTMLQTGQDMNSKYKETSLGGIAVNFVNC